MTLATLAAIQVAAAVLLTIMVAGALMAIGFLLGAWWERGRLAHLYLLEDALTALRAVASAGYGPNFTQAAVSTHAHHISTGSTLEDFARALIALEASCSRPE